ncbi:MAG: hypothetical protein K2P67_09015, partial [Gallionellaceae bacterium]|nr:hypothetical protein [Gallionellaceae bacterium]
ALSGVDKALKFDMPELANPDISSLAVSRRGLRDQAAFYKKDLMAKGMQTERQAEVGGQLLALANSGSSGAQMDLAYALSGVDKALKFDMPELANPDISSLAAAKQEGFRSEVNSGIAKEQADKSRPTNHLGRMTAQQVHHARGGGEVPRLGVLQNRQDPSTIYQEAPINPTEHPWNGVDVPDPNNAGAHGPAIRPGQGAKDVPGLPDNERG